MNHQIHKLSNKEKLKRKKKLAYGLAYARAIYKQHETLTLKQQKDKAKEILRLYPNIGIPMSEYKKKLESND